jgi:hypothetical protein
VAAFGYWLLAFSFAMLMHIVVHIPQQTGAANLISRLSTRKPEPSGAEPKAKSQKPKAENFKEREGETSQLNRLGVAYFLISYF